MTRLLTVIVALVLPFAAMGNVVTERSTVNGVSVAVTAGNLSPEASVWDFAVVLDAPGRKLPDDLLKSAVLVDPRGRKYQPLIWEGAPAAGDHRAGVLKFLAVKPRPQSIELRISRPGEKKPRSFNWLLGNNMMAQR
jgi:hypothetical protein